MEKIRRPHHSLDAHASLENLNACLHSLLALAEQGEWESIDEITDELLNALAVVEATKFSAHDANETDRASIQQTLSLLKLAIQQCVVRKEQIAPLLSALTRNKQQTKP